MNQEHVAHRYRIFLLALTGFILVGTVVELWFTEHVEGAVQLIPFGLCVLGVGVVIAALYAPRRRTLWILRVVMGGLALGSLFGIYEHVAHNLLFELEIRPNATVGDVFGTALYGASPILAPGILALAAVLALAATYRHPVLQRTPVEHHK